MKNKKKKKKTYLQYYFDHSKNYLSDALVINNDFLKYDISINFTSYESAVYAFVDFGLSLDFNGWSILCDKKGNNRNGIQYLNCSTIHRFRKANEYVTFILYYDNTQYSVMLLKAFTKAYETSLLLPNSSNYRFGIINMNTF